MADVFELRALRPQLPVLYTHVPKTGGSSITRRMAAIVGQDAIAGISTARADRRREFLQTCRHQSKRYVYGHFRLTDTFGIYDDANFIIALRHPLERILSFYFMLLRSEPKTPLALECLEDISGEGFRKFYARLIERRREDNLMCRYVCGQPDHDLAIEMLLRRYCLVWDCKSTDLACRALQRAMTGVDPQRQAFRPRNDAPVAASVEELASGARPNDYATFLPAGSRDLVIEMNREDMRLFRWFEQQS